MGYKGIGSKLKINNADFEREIMLSKQQDKLTNNAAQYMIQIANHAIRKLHYSNPLDREDCIQFGLLDLMLYWRSYDPAISNNAFSYFTQMAFNGYGKGYKKIHRYTVETVSLSSADDGEIYSI